MNDTVSMRTSPRWMKILLALSLTANLAVAGVVAGSAIKHALWHGKHGHHGHHGVSRLVKAVPEDERPAARERIARDESRLRELRDERRELRRAMRDIMTAETYAPERLSAALENDRRLADQHRAIVHGQIVDLFDAMEPEAREKAAKRIGRYMGTGRHKKRH